MFFGPTFDPKLPDLICYIRKDDSVRIGMTRGGDNDPVLYGEKRMWILVFSEKNLTFDPDTTQRMPSRKEKKNSVNGSAKARVTVGKGDTSLAFEIESSVTSKQSPSITDSSAIRITREPLLYEREPSEFTISGLISLISKIITPATGEKEAKAKAEALNDSIQCLRLIKYGDKIDSIYFNMVSFDLALNSVNRIVFFPPERRTDTLGFRFINYNLGNFEESHLGAGFGTGVNLGGQVPDTDRVKFYLFVHFYLCRAQLPISALSLGLVAGTNFITGSILNDVILGVRIGLVGSGGIIGGGAWVPRARRTNLFIGLDYKI